MRHYDNYEDTDTEYRGILGGSRADLDAMNNFLDDKKVRLEPIIDRVFDFDDSVAAFEYFKQAKHVGKVVIKL